MGEPCQRIIGRDRLDRHAYSLPERFVGAGAKQAGGFAVALIVPTARAVPSEGIDHLSHLSLGYAV